MKPSPARAFGKGVAAALASVFICLIVTDAAKSLGFGEAAAAGIGAACGIFVGIAFVTLFHLRSRQLAADTSNKA